MVSDKKFSLILNGAHSGKTIGKFLVEAVGLQKGRVDLGCTLVSASGGSVEASNLILLHFLLQLLDHDLVLLEQGLDLLVDRVVEAGLGVVHVHGVGQEGLELPLVLEFIFQTASHFLVTAVIGCGLFDSHT